MPKKVHLERQGLGFFPLSFGARIGCTQQMSQVPFALRIVVVVLAALVVLGGCASSKDEEPGRVVGKSSYTRPPWISKTMSVSPERRLGFMSHVKRRVALLELGIKQAQMEATSQAVGKFSAAFADYVVGIVKEREAMPPGDSESLESWLSSLRSLAMEASGRFEAPLVKPESVYWEEVEFVEAAQGTAGDVYREYRIYVLVSFEMSEITDRLAWLAGRLAEGGGGPKGRFEPALAAIDNAFPGLRAVAEESSADKKQVEAIQTEMDSAGASVDSSLDRKGPRGRKLAPKGGGVGGAAPQGQGPGKK